MVHPMYPNIISNLIGPVV